MAPWKGRIVFNPPSRHAGAVHVRLLGAVYARAYGIGPVAVRLEDTTITIHDRAAAISIGTSSLLLEDIAERLGPTYPGRFLPHRQANETVMLVGLHGRQRIGDLWVKAASASLDRCGQASFTLGNLRITVLDRDAATAAARGFAGAYEEACGVFAGMPSMQQIHEARQYRLESLKRRRKFDPLSTAMPPALSGRFRPDQAVHHERSL